MAKQEKFYYAEIYWKAPGKRPDMWRFTDKRKRAAAIKAIKKSQGDGIHSINMTERYEQ